MHQDRKPMVPGIVQTPKKSVSHKEQSPCQLDLTTATGLTVARVRTPFPPTVAAGGAAARAFPWGLSPSWQAPSVHSGTPAWCHPAQKALGPPTAVLRHPGQTPRSSTQGFSALSHLLFQLYLHFSQMYTLYCGYTLLCSPNPGSLCPQSSIHLSSLCPF